MEKDPQGRLLGVRGSVELKSINSVGGLASNNANVNGGGFMYQQSKHQPINSKVQSQKFTDNNQLQNQQQQQQFNYAQQQPQQQQQHHNGKTHSAEQGVNNVRRSAQAQTIGSLLDNNLVDPQY
jgi:hypothetical protein